MQSGLYDLPALVVECLATKKTYCSYDADCYLRVAENLSTTWRDNSFVESANFTACKGDCLERDSKHVHA